MITGIWMSLLLGGIALAAAEGKLAEVSAAMTSAAGDAAALCGGLLGSYALFLGLMAVARESGIAGVLAKGCGRLLRPLFPKAAKAGDAMDAIAMNLTANFLGMGNAATPFGLDAVCKLHTQDPDPQRAGDEVCMFLLLNTASVQLLPLQVVALRTAAGAADPWDILPGSVAVTALSAAVAVGLGLLCGRRRA